MIGHAYPWTLPALADDEHPLDPQDYLPRNKNSNVLTASFVLAGVHVLYGFTVTNTNVVAQYIHLFDASALPADGAAPNLPISVPGSTTLPIEWVHPRYMYNGIVLCNSSTVGTKTIGAADCWFDVQYH